MKGSTDENDLLLESIIFFYPTKEDLMKEKLLECGELVGLIQFFKYDLFSSTPKEFVFKKTRVVCQHFGRHSAFLVLSKDRFIADEANTHLTHIFQLFNMLHGTLNHIYTVYPSINQVHTYLRKALTPVADYIFHANRSDKGLRLLNIKHLLDFLQSKYHIKDGFFAYEKRILYSTLDSSTTFHIKEIFNLDKFTSTKEIDIELGSEIKLKSGVSLMRIFIPRTNLNNASETIDQASNLHTPPETINRTIHSSHAENGILLLNHHAKSITCPLLESSKRQYSSGFQEDTLSSFGETPGSGTYRTDDSYDHQESITNSSMSSSIYGKTPSFDSQLSKDGFHLTFSSDSYDKSLMDDSKPSLLRQPSYIVTNNDEFSKPTIKDSDQSNLSYSLNSITFVTIPDDDCDTNCSEDDIICLPTISSASNFLRGRPRALTNVTDLNGTERNVGDNHKQYVKWGDVPDKNNEIEYDESILYVQQNSRMTFVGIMEKCPLSNKELEDLWFFMLNRMADMDREIQIVPISGQSSKQNDDSKFRLNDNTHGIEFQRLINNNNSSYNKNLSSDQACMAFNARMKLNKNPERKMIGLSRGRDLISLNRNLPDRVTYLCQRSPEPR